MQKCKTDIYQDYEDMLFRAAVYKASEIEGVLLSSEMDTAVERDQFAKSRERFENLLDRKLQEKARNNKSAVGRRRLRKGLVVLAAVLALFAAAMLTVGAFRNQIFNLVLGIREQYTSFQLQEQEKGSGGQYVVDWKNAYVPTVVPDGYEISNVFLNSDLKKIVYQNIQDEGKNITYLEYAGDTVNVQLDTESASSVETVTIGGNPGTLTEKDGVVKLIWAMGSRMFELTGQADREVILQIAQSVKFNE
jgi:hypothetical protein